MSITLREDCVEGLSGALGTCRRTYSCALHRPCTNQELRTALLILEGKCIMQKCQTWWMLVGFRNYSKSYKNLHNLFGMLHPGQIHQVWMICALKLFQMYFKCTSNVRTIYNLNTEGILRYGLDCTLSCWNIMSKPSGLKVSYIKGCNIYCHVFSSTGPFYKK